jgi:hypothetical protein
VQKASLTFEVFACNFIDESPFIVDLEGETVRPPSNDFLETLHLQYAEQFFRKVATECLTFHVFIFFI